MKGIILNFKNHLKNLSEAIITNLNAINEISIRNELDFFDVFGVYYEGYKRDFKENREFKFYTPFLEDKTFKLTERYFDIRKIKELKKYKDSLN